ncbi:MAG: choice-of-anchor D domain-containing protein, partial [Terriglobia bacterium]
TTAGADDVYDSGSTAATSEQVSLQPSHVYYVRIWTITGGNSYYSDTKFETAVLAPAVGFSPASLSFPPQIVGATSSVQILTVTNTGTANLTISRVTIGGANASDFAKSADTCTGATVTPNGTCAVGVTFAPTAGSTRIGTLTITANAPDTPQSVALSGTGQDFTLAASSGSSTSATVAPGQSATYILSVAGTGGFDQSVSFTCAGAPSEAVCTVSPSPVIPGSLATNITVSVTTTAPSASEPRSRQFPQVPPLSRGLREMLLLALVLSLVAWANRRRDQPGVSRWQPARAMLAWGLFLALALSGCGGGGKTPNPGTPAGNYTLTVTGSAGSGSATLSHSVTLTLNAS